MIDNHCPTRRGEDPQEVENVKRCIVVSQNELLPALFKDGRLVLVRWLTRLLSSVWTDERVPLSWPEWAIVSICKTSVQRLWKPSRDKLISAVLLRGPSATRED